MRTDTFISRLLLITLAAILVSVVWQSVPLIQAELLARRAEPRLVTARGELAGDEQATIELFQAARHSVVSISTAERVVDPWTRNVYDMPRGTGSGFVWDGLGHVVTNAHVVEGASRAVIRLADGRSYPARLIGTDPSHDLAVLRIGVAAERPDPLPIGTSADLEVGQKVFAIGNPFGLDWTLTSGIVSALDRELPTGGGIVITGLIQTDAAINPGNSGGPLLDSAGRLVGVNTAIFSPSGSNAGIGFAALARRSGLPGVVVIGVEPNSPAERAGLRPAEIGRDGRIAPRDVIVSLEDEAIGSTEDLTQALDALEAGQEVTLGVLRDGERRELTTTLAAAG